MAKKSANTLAREAREKREREHLAKFGGDRYAASIDHHRQRYQRALAARDYSTMRDAEMVIKNLGGKLWD